MLCSGNNDEQGNGKGGVYFLLRGQCGGVGGWGGLEVKEGV